MGARTCGARTRYGVHTGRQYIDAVVLPKYRIKIMKAARRVRRATRNVARV